MDSGADFDFVRNQSPNHIWSFVVEDGARRSTWRLANGLRRVNVMGYVVTKKPALPDIEYDVIY